MVDDTDPHSGQPEVTRVLAGLDAAECSRSRFAVWFCGHRSYSRRGRGAGQGAQHADRVTGVGSCQGQCLLLRGGPSQLGSRGRGFDPSSWLTRDGLVQEGLKKGRGVSPYCRSRAHAELSGMRSRLCRQRVAAVTNADPAWPRLCAGFRKTCRKVRPETGDLPIVGAEVAVRRLQPACLVTPHGLLQVKCG